MLVPDFILKRVMDITPEILEQFHIRAMILDVDNTLSTHGNPVPFEGVEAWIQQMRALGVRMIISSNNFAKRVAPFADSLDLEFISMSCKPFPFGMRRAIARIGIPKEEIAVVGDQIFTDVLGGNLLGITTLLVEPLELEGGFFFRLKRVIERPFIWWYNRKQRRT